MKAIRRIACILLAIIALTGCDYTARRAWHILEHAEALRYSDPDSCLCIIDSLMRMEIHYGERFRMEMAMLQAETLFDSLGEPREVRGCFVTTLPDLADASEYYKRKGDLDQAAHAAMLYGFDQKRFGDPKAATNSFKKAELYALMKGDSLIAARADYHIGDLLYYDGMERDAIAVLQKADLLFGKNYAEKAMNLYKIASCYALAYDFDSTKLCLNKALVYANSTLSEKTKQKILIVFAALYRQKGDYEKAIEYLNTFKSENKDSESNLYFNLNMSNVFLSMGAIDSAEYYLRRIEPMLTDTTIRKETVISCYASLSALEQEKGNVTNALLYREKHEDELYDLMKNRQEQNVKHAMLKYDYESLQNRLGKRIGSQQRIITIATILLSLLLVTAIVFLARIAKMRKQEVEMKNNLFLFTQRNKELADTCEAEKRVALDYAQRLAESDETNRQAALDYADRIDKMNKSYEEVVQDYGQKLTDKMKKEVAVMQKAYICQNNSGDKILLNSLYKTVFATDDHWKEMMKAFDKLYPNVRKEIARHESELTDDEQKSLILSFLNVSRQDEALMLGTSVAMVDKIRNSVRKKTSGWLPNSPKMG